MLAHRQTFSTILPVMTVETLDFPLVEFLTALLLTGVTPTSAKTLHGTL